MITQTAITTEADALTQEINLAIATKRLMANPDFVTVFKMYYFDQYVQAQVAKMAEYPVDSPEHQNIVLALRQVSALQNHLQTILSNGAMAQQSLDELNAIPLSEYDHE